MGGLFALLFSLPFIVLCALLVGVGALLRAIFGGGRRHGAPWFVPLLVVIALFLAFQGARLLSPVVVPLVLIGLGLLLLRGGSRRHAPARVRVAAARPAVGAASSTAPVSLPMPSAPLAGANLAASGLEGRLRRLPSPTREEALALYEEARRAVAALDEGTPAHDAYTIRATLTDYLPESVNAFLDIPESRRMSPLPGGQTPLALLQSQLRLMREGLERAVGGHNLARAERLLSHGRFLEERFGKEGDFKI